MYMYLTRSEVNTARCQGRGWSPRIGSGWGIISSSVVERTLMKQKVPFIYVYTYTSGWSWHYISSVQDISDAATAETGSLSW